MAVKQILTSIALHYEKINSGRFSAIQICCHLLTNFWKYVVINLKEDMTDQYLFFVWLGCKDTFPIRKKKCKGRKSLLLLVISGCLSDKQSLVKTHRAGSEQDVTRYLGPLHEIQRPFFGALCHCRVDSFDTKCSASSNPPCSVRSHCPYSLDLLF